MITIDDFLKMKLYMYQQKYDRFRFISRRTKKKRIKQKVELKATVSLSMIGHIKKIINMRNGDADV
ncbi:hypothetical protein [Bacillus mesophilum]|uniref:Uncharacterized protein n=1 Tax=Bacillus mesophilum TaxID=1071718 RepID=A0A7V7UWK7_9BACI|nr:hypothetical protein [Bacillus mesophilum]KAB2334270.1 hypothetical protein F7732_09375 [Bacillus mesophilum]